MSAAVWTPLSPDDVLPRVLPAKWSRLRVPPGMHPHCSVYLRADGLLMVASVARYRDGGRWLHVSASYADHEPSWPTMCDVKDVLIGHEKVAVQVHPRTSEHYSLHPYCLHLWCRLDADVVPDLRDEEGRV